MSRRSRAIGAFVVALLLASTAEARAPLPGDSVIAPKAEEAWALTGTLNAARLFHTATLLRNGKVLVAGGDGGAGSPLSSAELYDPVTGTWSFTGSMATSREGHFAFLLPTGAVLVLGGDPCCITNATAELYDPDTGTWSSTGNSGPMVGLYGATLLESGKVFVTGVGPGYVSAAWLYDPMQETWSQTGRDPVYRQYPDLALLPSGRVLVAKGTTDADEVFIASSAELYDPGTGAWTLTRPPNVPRVADTENVLPDGSVLAAGGISYVFTGMSASSVTERRSEIYESNRTWRRVGDLNDARFSHTATLLPNRRVLVAGGAVFHADSTNLLNSVELYDPITTTWTYANPLVVARQLHTATLLSDGSVLVVGGYGLGGRLISAEIFPAAASLPAIVAVIEYLHAGLNDDYFMTAIPDEIAKLDNGTIVGWTRTGFQFNGYAATAAGTSPVCRFYSTAFAPRSPHFHTPFADECATVGANPDWLLESTAAFNIAFPAADGSCAAGLIPVYRLYNNGQSGAPSHRYTTDLAVRAQIIAQGWVPEGLGPGAVEMCSP